MATSLELVFRKARSAERRGDEAEARRLLEEVLQSYPKNVTARRSLARLNDPGASSEAPSQAELRRLIEAHERGDHAETIRLGEMLARRGPDIEIVHTLVGAAKLDLRDYSGAEKAFGESARLQPLNAAHYNNLGIALHGQGRLAEAEKACAKAIKLDADYADAHFNLGILHEDAGRFEEAIACCRTVLRLAPDHVPAHYKLGVLYRESRRWPEAIDVYVKLLAIAPDHAAGLHDLGRALMGIGHVERAIDTFRLAIRAEPANAGPHCDLGLALTAVGRLEEAAAAFARATESLPSHYGIWGRLLNLQAYLCDWSARHALPMLPIETDQGGIPFDALPFEDDPLRQLQRSQIYAARQFRPVQAPFIAPRRNPGGRIRIGYLSADFYDHATLHLMSGLLREHDRSRFEVRAYDFSPVGGDEGLRRIGDQVDAFIDIRRMTDRDAVDLIRSHDLDLAIDLKGYTKDCRAQILAERIAPVQISYLGYPGSLGADFMDYLIADPVVVPAGDERYY
ncbi:MAG TPA: tetratricopeptide repeat protein, partial [Sphingomonas sp.]|nr:tetratricopeptide repeat protein [Sphingomonas sp.]